MSAEIDFDNLYSRLDDDSSENESESEQNEIAIDKELVAQIDEINRRLNEIQTNNDIAPAKSAPFVNPSEENNLLNENIRTRYLARIYEIENDVLSLPLSTTTTIYGVLENVIIDEKAIDQFETSERIVVIKSNYGSKIHPSYVPPMANAPAKSTRGRKPKLLKRKTERKKQGNGDCFNSQITFVVKTDIPNAKSPSKFKEYKFKVFRNNKLQLPGAQPAHLHEVLQASQDVIDLLNRTLYRGETKIKLLTLSPQMKNYKFYVKMDYGRFIDLNLLKRIFLVEKLRDELRGGKIEDCVKLFCNCNDRDCRDCFNRKLIDSPDIRAIMSRAEIENDISPPHPPINDVLYTYEDTKLSVRFSTPIMGKPKKKALVNIFPGSKIAIDYSPDMTSETWGGKINILGALYEETTRELYVYLLYIFQRYRAHIIVSPAVAEPIVGAQPSGAPQQQIAIDLTDEQKAVLNAELAPLLAVPC